MIARSLQVRLLAVLVLAVGIALGTVAVVARASTTAEFTRYVEGNRVEMQAVAREIAASVGDRLLVTNQQGRVIIDSSEELVGRTLTPDQVQKLGPLHAQAPPPSRADLDVLFVRRGIDSALEGPIWTRSVPPGSPVLPMLGLDPAQPNAQARDGSAGWDPLAPDDREQVFVGAVTRSLLVGVLVGGGVAIALGLAFARGILRPVGALTEAARHMERGDLSQRVVVKSRDEIGQLAHAFNAMADGLARHEQLRRTMVTDVAHELRTPLTNLRGYLEALRDGVTPASPTIVDSLYEEAMLLNHLVDDLQDLTLSEAGRLELRREAVDAQTLVVSAAQGVQARAKEQGITLVVRSVPACVLADPHRIGQVLRNLLANALTHTPAGGEVELSAAAAPDGVRFEVRDTGCGIAREHLPNVFERFYRVDASRARATGGAGIGLAVVKQLVEAHGSGVSASSEVGVGSCFSFTLDYAREPAQGAKALVTPRSALLSAG